MHMIGKASSVWTDLSVQTTTLGLLGLKWERPPEPCHDYLFYISRSPDNLRLATASSAFYTDHIAEIWELPERRMRYRLQTPGASAISLEWLQERAFVTSGHDSLLTIRREDEVLGR